MATISFRWGLDCDTDYPGLYCGGWHFSAIYFPATASRPLREDPSRRNAGHRPSSQSQAQAIEFAGYSLFGEPLHVDRFIPNIPADYVYSDKHVGQQFFLCLIPLDHDWPDHLVYFIFPD